MSIFPKDISKTIFEQVKMFESPGGRPILKVYLDPVGVPTSGWGAIKGWTRADVGRVISIEKAESDLQRDLDEAEAAVRRLVKVPLNQNQYDVLVDFVFNLGAGEKVQKSTLLKKLNKGEYAAVPSELMKWVKGRVNGELVTLTGLARRRVWEAHFWEASVNAPTPYTPVRSPEATVSPEPPVTLFSLIADLLLKLFNSTGAPK